MLRKLWQRITASLRAFARSAGTFLRTAGVSPAPLTSPLNLPLPSVAPASSRQGLPLPFCADGEIQTCPQDAGVPPQNLAERDLRMEIARLRAENRALLNSILGIAGIPPIVVSETEAATEAAMLHTLPRTAAPSRNAGVSPANLTLPLNLFSRANSENQTNTESQPRGRDARVTQDLAPAQNRASDSSSSPPRPDKPESPAPKRVRFKTDFRAPRPSGTPRNPAAPRRRSWQQINRMLELASARKPSQET